MQEKELKNRDKKTQRMSRDGIVEVNQSKGERTLITSRLDGGSFDRTEQIQQEVLGRNAKKTSSTTQRRKKQKQVETASKKDHQSWENSKEPTTDEPHEKPTKGMEKETRLKNKASKLNEKLKKSREKLPTRKVVKKERIFDEEKGKSKTRLYFDDEIKTVQSKSTLSRLGGAGVGKIRHKIDQKISQVEKENVGVESAHKTARFTEKSVHKALRFKKHMDQQPFKKHTKLQHKTDKSNVNLIYQQQLNENPSLANQNMVRKFLQKKQIKKNYAKKAKNSAHTAKSAYDKAKGTANVAASIGKKLVDFLVGNKTVMLVIAVIFLAVLCFMSIFSSCSVMFGSAVGHIVSGTYQAEDEAITDSESLYTQLELDLKEKIKDVPKNYPGYDEYQYEIDEIAHDPFILISFLSAVYEDFEFNDVKKVVNELFLEQYKLEFQEIIEIRTNTLDDGTIETYEYKTLITKLTTKPLEDIVLSKMNEEQKEQYHIFKDTQGLHQYYSAPLENWQSKITSHFGYRTHPITGKRDFHKGLDMAAPLGTPIKSISTGKVIAAGFTNIRGNYVTIQDATGEKTEYFHCESLKVKTGQQVKAGEEIATVGSTGNSTGTHLHLEIIRKGTNLNPLFLLFNE